MNDISPFLKRKISLLVFIFLALFGAFLLCSTGMAKNQSAQAIGTVQDARGAVKAKNDLSEDRRLGIKDSLYQKDELTTGVGAFLRISLSDGTSFILGSESRLVLDEFVFKNSSQESKIDFFAAGVFRFKTGKIVEEKPENMQVRMTVGITGVRGTQVACDAKPTRSFVVLEEVGQNAAKKIHVVVKNQTSQGLAETAITEPGFGSVIEAGKAPGPVFEVPDHDLQQLQDQLQPPGGGSGPSGFDAVDQLGFGQNSGGGPNARDMAFEDNAPSSHPDSHDSEHD